MGKLYQRGERRVTCLVLKLREGEGCCLGLPGILMLIQALDKEQCSPLHTMEVEPGCLACSRARLEKHVRQGA